MTLDDSKTIGIVGAGQMGRGISQVCATAGYHVLLVDVAEKRSISVQRLGGTLQNDTLKEYIAERMALPTRTLTAAHHRYYRLLCETGSYMVSDQHQWERLELVEGSRTA